jgi:hypothetical protein
MTYPNGNATIPENGERLIDGAFINGNGLAGGYNRQAKVVAALAGGAAPTGNVALLGPAAIVEIATVTTANDSTQLPSAQGNQILDVVNSTANDARVYSNARTPADTINNVAGTTPVVLAAGKTTRFISTQPGKWFRLTSA